MNNQPLGPVTFDGALPLPPDLKADLNEKRRALMDKLKELEAEIGEG